MKRITKVSWILSNSYHLQKWFSTPCLLTGACQIGTCYRTTEGWRCCQRLGLHKQERQITWRTGRVLRWRRCLPDKQSWQLKNSNWNNSEHTHYRWDSVSDHQSALGINRMLSSLSLAIKPVVGTLLCLIGANSMGVSGLQHPWRQLCGCLVLSIHRNLPQFCNFLHRNTWVSCADEINDISWTALKLL